MGGIDSDIIFSFFSDNLIRHMGTSYQGKNLLRYLKALGAKTCVLEKEYIDKDYMIDYQKFYSRSFGNNGKVTKRMHFFTEDFSAEEFKKSLEDNDINYMEYLNELYLGFVVIKPIKDKNVQPFIGRTLLKPPEKEGKKDSFIDGDYDASLFGVPLALRSVPFQAQDQGVSACATIALWSALHPLGDIFGIQRNSPAEITEISTSLPSLSRKFPSSGLTWEQMINYVKSIGLDIETIDPADVDEDTIQTAVMVYIKAGFPLVAALKLTKGKEEYKGRHAAVITGYQCDDNGNLKELYVHDDQIGPYGRAKPVNGSFKLWENEWCNEYKYDKVELEKLLIPIYPKIRLTFFRMYDEYKAVRKKAINLFGPVYDYKLHLTTIREYKKYLIEKSIRGKEEVLAESLPRFMWVIRTYYRNQPKEDVVYDGTSVYPHVLPYHIDFI